MSSEIYDDNHFAHYGTPRHSGRYPWGSGNNDDEWGTRNRHFLDMVAKLRKEGMSDTEIARASGMTTTQFRARNSNAKEEKRRADQTQAQRYADDGWSPSAIGRRMGRNESSIRAMLAEGAAEKASAIQNTANMLKQQVEEKVFIDTGKGVEHQLNITKNRLDTAVAVLRDQGYTVHNLSIQQVATDKYTIMRVLAKPGTLPSEIDRNRTQVRQITEHSTDHGRSYIPTQPPLSLSSRRVAVKYADDGGDKEDGVIYVRPGKKDLTIGSNNYGQVRILVDGTHYLKGMAIYNDKLPDGVDVLFNTAKSNTGLKKDAMKPITSDDPKNPFGAIVRQVHDEKGNVSSVMNMVGSPTKPESGEAGQWDKWSRALSSQMLSKQDSKFIQKQLDVTLADHMRDFNEINSLTNPTVRKDLLLKFADEMDASSVDLKAASLKGTVNRVLLPIPSMKPNEIYSPNFNNGDRVVLIRHPHAGTFEIPELTVNNRNREARRLIGNGAKVDAVGIHQSVAQHLSGADFDGDTVLVIPNRSKSIKVTDPLQELKGFDPMIYKLPPDSSITRMNSQVKGHEMGKISNLITDMSLRGAEPHELARAVKHSMVVIDAENHELNYKQSEKDHAILDLKRKYQQVEGKPGLGASTLISRARSPQYLPQLEPRKASRGGPFDPVTGKRVFEPTGRTITDRQGNKKLKLVAYEKLSPQVTDDAHQLSSGTQQEILYATHSNKLKGLAGKARKEAIPIKSTPYSPSAKNTYSKEVESLNAKLKLAERNAPYERQAQLYARAAIGQIRQANPGMDKDQVKKHKFIELDNARHKTGASRFNIEITQSEWDAIQAGAISGSKLTKILTRADADQVKKLAMPKSHILMTPSKTARARQMIDNGYTQAEAAAALGVSLTTLKVGISE